MQQRRLATLIDGGGNATQDGLRTSDYWLNVEVRDDLGPDVEDPRRDGPTVDPALGDGEVMRITDAEQKAIDKLHGEAEEVVFESWWDVQERLRKRAIAEADAKGRFMESGTIITVGSELFEEVWDAMANALQYVADLGGRWNTEILDTKLGIRVEYETVSPILSRWARGYSYDLIRGLTRRNMEELRKIHAEWLAGTEDVDVLTRRISALPGFSRQRAKLVATTETTRAMHEAEKVVYKQSGVVVGLQVSTANDDRVCEICAPLGGLVYTEGGAEPAPEIEQRVYAIQAPIDGGFQHPGGFGRAGSWAGMVFEGPPFHPGCRCGTIPIVKSFYDITRDALG